LFELNEVINVKWEKLPFEEVKILIKDGK